MIELDNNMIQSIEYEETTIDDNSSITGVCELGNAEIQLINDNNEYSSLAGKWVSTILGSFYVYDVKPVQERVNIKLNCYDIKYKLEKKYDPNIYIFPMSLLDWRNQVGLDSGLIFGDTEFPNSDMILEKQPYVPDDATNRDVMKMILAAGLSIFNHDKDDVCYFDWFDDNQTFILQDWNELTTEQNSTTPINQVILGRGDANDDVFYPKNIENSIAFRIDNNYILDPQDTGTEYDIRNDRIQSIYNRINGFSFVKYNVRSQFINNKSMIKLGSKILYNDVWENQINSYVMTKKISWIGGDLNNSNNWEVTLSAEEISDTKVGKKYNKNIIQNMRDISFKVDQENEKIRAVVNEQNNQSAKLSKLEINNESISQQVSNINNTVDNMTGQVSQIENTVQETITSSNAQFEVINKTLSDGVEKLKNNLVTIDVDGIKVSTNIDNFKALLSNKSVLISDSGKEIAFFGYDDNLKKTIARIKELETEKVTAGYHRCEKFQDVLDKRTGWFWVGDN